MATALDKLLLAIEVAAPLLFAAAYLKRSHTLAGQGRPVPAWRQLCFAAALVLLVLTIGWPLEQPATELVLAHMAQHVLLADIISLLFVLGLTGPLVQPVLAHRATRPLRHLTHPVVAISIFTFNLFLWHLPPLYQSVLDSPALHSLEHTLFLATGAILWMPLFGPLPKPAWFGKGAHVIYAAGIWLPGMVLANFLMWSGTVLYPDYEPTVRAAGIDPIADQGIAGAILMTECMLMALLLFGLVFMRWAREDSERQELLDLAHERGVELSPERAERAVASGRGAELRARIER